jgi:hypothetical protein
VRVHCGTRHEPQAVAVDVMVGQGALGAQFLVTVRSTVWRTVVVDTWVRVIVVGIVVVMRWM